MKLAVFKENEAECPASVGTTPPNEIKANKIVHPSIIWVSFASPDSSPKCDHKDDLRDKNEQVEAHTRFLFRKLVRAPRKRQNSAEGIRVLMSMIQMPARALVARLFCGISAA